MNSGLVSVPSTNNLPEFTLTESLKVEAIIRQTSMLKALNRDADAIEMIREMLLSDKFVDIRGQLILRT